MRRYVVKDCYGHTSYDYHACGRFEPERYSAGDANHHRLYSGASSRPGITYASMVAHRRSHRRFYRALDSRHGAGDRVRPAAFTATTASWLAPLLALWRAAHTRAARRFCLGRLHLSAPARAHPPSAISAPHSMATPLSATDSAWTRAAAQGSAYPERGQHGVFIGWRKDSMADRRDSPERPS